LETILAVGAGMVDIVGNVGMEGADGTLVSVDVALPVAFAQIK